MVVNDNNTVRDVLVYIQSGLLRDKHWPIPSEPIILEQRGCRYFPHVFGVRAGQELIIRNGDDTAHFIKASPSDQAGFASSHTKKGMKSSTSLVRADKMVKFTCDVHPWESAWCAVVEHPFFAVTNENGEFEINGLPDGEYRLAMWHEKFKIQEKTVRSAGDTRTVEFVVSSDDRVAEPRLELAPNRSITRTSRPSKVWGNHSTCDLQGHAKWGPKVAIKAGQNVCNHGWQVCAVRNAEIKAEKLTQTDTFVTVSLKYWSTNGYQATLPFELQFLWEKGNVGEPIRWSVDSDCTGKEKWFRKSWTLRIPFDKVDDLKIALLSTKWTFCNGLNDEPVCLAGEKHADSSAHESIYIYSWEQGF